MSSPLENLTLCSPRLSSGQDPHKPVLVKTLLPNELAANHVLIKVDRFGWSTNNMTYQALGDSPHFRYFDFHPAPASKSDDVSPETHGLVPVWGFGTVIKSTHPKISPGIRVYGYLAPTRYLLLPVSPSDINKYYFYVPRPHLPRDRRPYNQLTFCANDLQYDPSPDGEDNTMLYRPLFWTSYWCEDWLHYTSYRGGSKRVLISSASSKTAFTLAYNIRRRAVPGMHVVGLTSSRNLDFTRGLGLYDEVLTYDELETASVFSATNQRWIYVDVAGNDALNERVFNYFTKLHTANNKTTKIVAAIQLGLTNLSPSSKDASSTKWSTNTFESSIANGDKIGQSDSDSPVAELEQFFMPEWLTLRARQMTPPQIIALQTEAWQALMRDCRSWVTLERIYGGTHVLEAYSRMAPRSAGGGSGDVRPDKGQIWSLWDSAEEASAAANEAGKGRSHEAKL